MREAALIDNNFTN